MAVPTTKEEFKEYCLRQLGHPVITINIDDAQVDDAVDAALNYFQDFHYDGTELVYTKHQLTASDITNEYIPISNNVIGVTRVFPVSSTTRSTNILWNVNYQLMMQDVWNLSSAQFTDYVITRQHMRQIEMLFVGEKAIRYNRLTDRLYLDFDWEAVAIEGLWLIIEARVVIDPAQYIKVWDDRMLKKLATAYIKRTWGANMKKFSGMQLPGGITMNGQQIYDEAMEEAVQAENTIRLTYEAPPMFIVG